MYKEADEAIEQMRGLGLARLRKEKEVNTLFFFTRLSPSGIGTPLRGHKRSH